MDLSGKSFLVTGAGSGIGQSTAMLLAEAGAMVTVADLDEKGAEETAGAIRKSGGNAQAVKADVSSEVDVQAMIDRAVKEFGRLDGLCNAAGIAAAVKTIDEMSLDAFNRNLKVNLAGSFLCVKYGARAILGSSGEGSIVMVASTAALLGFAGAADYCAAKSGILGLTRSASCEYAPKGVRVNVVLPGSTKTPMFLKSMEEHGIEDYLLSTHPIGRFAEPSEIGTAIRFLLSSESSFMTGAVIPVDGGNTSI